MARHRSFSEDDAIHLRQLLESGHSIYESSQILGFALSTIYRNLRSYSIKHKFRHSFNSREDKYIKSNVGKKTLSEIAAHLGYPLHSIKGRVKRLGLSGTYEPCHFIKCRHSSYDVELCRQLHDEGLSIPLIAEKMEIPVYTVKGYVNYSSRRQFVRH